jgi:hypothetical protein
MSYIEKITQYFQPNKGRTADQGTNDRDGQRITNFDGSKRVLVRPVAAVHAARFVISSVNVNPAFPDRWDCDYFVSPDGAQKLVEDGSVFLVKDRHGKVVEENLAQ